jgi:retron-type reverse transcriptase
MIDTLIELAAAMNMPPGYLRRLTSRRKGTSLARYTRDEVPKKSGGTRLILKPTAQLAEAQRWVLDSILADLDVEPQAHGYVPGRSIVTAAAPHVGKAIVVHLDLQDFFHSITFPRVKAMFRALEYGPQAAATLALLCTAVIDEAHPELRRRGLPQGACTSPAISNVVCRRLDRRLNGLCKNAQFDYTRYADDITISGNRPAAVGRLLRTARLIIAEEGFAENQGKTHAMRRGQRQEVVGLTVNEKPAVSRRERRRLRALLHNAARDGLEEQNREGCSCFREQLRGRVSYVAMVEPEKGGRWRRALRAALEADEHF